MVGGCVRDGYMDKKPKDIDLVVEGLSMNEIKVLLAPFGRIDEVGESFAVLKFVPSENKKEDFDIAVPRRDKKIGEGHKGIGVETSGVGILEDLKRRDFTINSIAICLNDESLLDPYNGIKDISSGILRAVDTKAFSEDPLRILRGIGFSSRFRYRIEEKTMKLMKLFADDIMSISGERILEEFNKVINKSGDCGRVFYLLHETGVDMALFGRKCLKYREGFEFLDPISFYWMLGIIGDVDPGDFFKNRLKGDKWLENRIRSLDKIFSFLIKEPSDINLKFFLSKEFSKYSEVMDAILIPPRIDEICLEMRKSDLPVGIGELVINGEDVQILLGIEGKEVGEVLDWMLREALEKKYLFTNRTESLKHIKKYKNENY
jgi:hypothetical protein